MRTLQDLVSHKWYANARLLAAVQEAPAAAQDKQVLELLHHILIANRFWLTLSRGVPFSLEKESQVPESLDVLVDQYKETYAAEAGWIKQITDGELERRLQASYFKGQTFSVEEGILQICLHSHGHRAQVAIRLRELGGTPPSLDFVIWLRDNRPPVVWPPPISRG
jgi:uncharacterized damage-inducible protein DinB